MAVTRHGYPIPMLFPSNKFSHPKAVTQLRGTSTDWLPGEVKFFPATEQLMQQPGSDSPLMNDSCNERNCPYHNLIKWLATLDQPSRFPVPQVVSTRRRDHHCTSMTPDSPTTILLLATRSFLQPEYLGSTMYCIVQWIAVQFLATS